MLEIKEHNHHQARLAVKLAIFLDKKKPLGTNSDDLEETYTRSTEYLTYTTQFHRAADIAEFLVKVINQIKPGDTITDVGCHSGFTGLSVVMAGKQRVTFHDFEGIGLEFVEWYIEHNDIGEARIIPYGTNPSRSKWVLAFDVLEHTGNQLAALKWLELLTNHYVAMTYPLIGYHPPYIKPIDEYVDDEAIQMVIDSRYTIKESYIADGHRFTIYEV